MLSSMREHKPERNRYPYHYPENRHFPNRLTWSVDAEGMKFLSQFLHGGPSEWTAIISFAPRLRPTTLELG